MLIVTEGVMVRMMVHETTTVTLVPEAMITTMTIAMEKGIIMIVMIVDMTGLIETTMIVMTVTIVGMTTLSTLEAIVNVSVAGAQLEIEGEYQL